MAAGGRYKRVPIDCKGDPAGSPDETDLSRMRYFSAYSAALAPAMRPEVVLQPIVTPS